MELKSPIALFICAGVALVCLITVFITFGMKKKYNGGRGGNTEVDALPIERRDGACGSPVRLRQSFPHKDSSQKSRHCKTN